MQEQKSKTTSLLIRGGAGESNILRIKFSIPISNQDKALIRILLSEGVRNLPEEIGPEAKMIVRSLANIVPRIQMISLRPQQIIVDLGAGNIWAQEEEDTVRELINSILTARGLTIQWFAQRKTGQRLRPL